MINSPTGYFRRLVMTRFGALLALAMPVAGYARCPDTALDPSSYTSASEDNQIVVYFRGQPGAIPIGAFFSLDITICDSAKRWAGTLTVDASMPAHGHGMNYQPEVQASASGFIAEGLLFHMPGQWRLDFNLQGDAGSQHIYAFIDIE